MIGIAAIVIVDVGYGLAGHVVFGLTGISVYFSASCLMIPPYTYSPTADTASLSPP